MLEEKKKCFSCVNPIDLDYRKSYSLMIFWLTFLVIVTVLFKSNARPGYEVAKEIICAAAVVAFCVYSVLILPRYIKYNIIGLYVYHYKHNGEEHCHLNKPNTDFRGIYIREAVCGWFKTDVIIVVSEGKHKPGQSVTEKIDPISIEKHSDWKLKIIDLSDPSFVLTDKDHGDRVTLFDIKDVWQLIEEDMGVSEIVRNYLSGPKVYEQKEELLFSAFSFLATIDFLKDTFGRSKYGKFSKEFWTEILIFVTGKSSIDLNEGLRNNSSRSEEIRGLVLELRERFLKKSTTTVVKTS